MKDLQREILNQVASGQISAGEGATRLEALASESSAPSAVQAPVRPAPGPVPAPAPRSVRVVSQLGSATIIGDPTVAVATAEGPHRARQDGEILSIELGLLRDDDTFSFGPGTRWLNRMGSRSEGLIVRMNPDLPLLVRVRAGNVRVIGVHGPISAEVQAGDCRIEDFRGELHAFVQAGSYRAAGRLDGGSSSIRCQMGEVKLNLDKSSSVLITASATLGDISIDGSSLRRSESGREFKLGSGAGTLELECGLGDIQVNVG
jgi:hypothetical protein